MQRPINAVPARNEDLATAFRLVFQHIPPDGREGRVANSLYLVSRGELEQEGVLVVHGNDGLLGALVCAPLKGASGLVWPPGAVRGPSRIQVEDALVQQAQRWLRSRGAKLAQALLEPEETFLAKPFLRNGFAQVTSLHYMRHDLAGLGDARGCLADTEQRKFLAYPYVDPRRFRDTLLRTYENTLDCPELNGVRTGEEILEGHQAQGLFDPEHWWLLEEAGQPSGVLLLADLPDLGAWDLSYVGVVPEARRRGLGRCLVQKALAEAHAAGVNSFILAVDGRNHPALQLYTALGFRGTETRAVYLAFF